MHTDEKTVYCNPLNAILSMDYKQFELWNREYRLFKSGKLQVWTISKNDWVDVLPKQVTVSWKTYYRYALWDPKYDWTNDNYNAICKYEQKVRDFNSRQQELEHNWPSGSIITRNLSDIVGPKYPELHSEWDWKRFYLSHGSLVCKYWHGLSDSDDKFVVFLDVNKDNIFDVLNWTYWKMNSVVRGWGRKRVPVWVVNTILSNAGSYSTEYIASALDLSGRFVTKVILGKGWYDKVGARSQYAMNIRSCRGAFYGITCYEFESVYDFINRVLVHWSNDRRYDEYATYGERKRNTKGRMGYWVWVQKYGRDERVSKELVKKWIEMNAEFIWDEDAVEELKVYVDNWSLGGDRCWNLDRYNKYMIANKARMPQKIKIMKGVPCSLRAVWIHSSGSLYDLSDFILINCFDYCGWQFQDIDNWKSFIETIEPEPDWNKYEENWYDSADAFWDSYVSMLWWISVWEFRSAYGDMLRSIPYTV